MGLTKDSFSGTRTYTLSWLFILVTAISSLAQTATVQGVVVDTKTREPLPFTNIFVNNSTIGTAADGQGIFKLMYVPVGPNELVFSFVGYKTVQTKIDLKAGQVITLNAELAPDEELLETVVVEGKRDKVWEGQLKQFTRIFFGIYSSAEECKIINPEVLEFREVGPVLFATASEPIQIENNKLGYTVFYFLKKFQSKKGGDYAILGNARFEEMKTYEPKVESKWIENRWEVYQGSARHLFSSILKSQTRENGFEIFKDITGFENSPRTSIFRAELGRSIESFDTTKLTIVPDPSKQTFNISFKTNKIEVHNTKVPSKVRNYDDISYQVSWLEFTDTIRVDGTGRFIDPEGVVTSGYMSALRVGDQLPNDYQPVNPRSGKGHSAGDLFEKTYVHTDKEYYYPGERIWYKAYISRYSGLVVNSPSKTLYVELLNSTGKMMLEQTIRLDSGHAVGDMILPDSMATGTYFLRAYTNFQRNFGDEVLFSKPLPILKLTLKPVYTNERENEESNLLTMAPTKTSYKTRDNIKLKIELKDQHGNPSNGDLSISVTDASQVIKVPAWGSILDKFPTRKEEINKPVTSRFRAESGFVVRGQFRNPRGKGEKADLNFIRFHPSEYFVVETDKHGNFTLQDMHFEGETEVSLNSVKGPLAGSVKLMPRDAAPFHPPKPAYSIETVDQHAVQRLFTGFNKPQDSQMLEEVIVRGEVDTFKKQAVETNNHAYGDVGEYVFGEDRIKTQFPNLLFTLQALNISGLIVNPTDNAVYFARHSKPKMYTAGGPADVEEDMAKYSPMVTLDGMPMLGAAGDALRAIDPNGVGSIEVTKSQSTIRGSLAPYGVIAVFSKRGTKNDRSEFTNANFLKIQGYTLPNEFRHPNYEYNRNSAEVDYRSTLYWNPLVTISQDSGSAQVSFFASDLSGTYRVVVEGVNGDGEPVRSVSFITVK